MSTLAKREFSAELIGQINGQSIELGGNGTIDPVSGITSGKYMLRRLPNDFDPTVLSACLITGYPNVCATKGGIENPFGEYPYRYERAINFRNGGRLRLRTECKYVNGRLDSQFYLEGHVTTPALDTVEPIIESWEPGQDAQVHGNFVVAWRCKDGSLFVAEADTKYTILADVKIDHFLHRYIAVTPKFTNDSLSLHQDSELFLRNPYAQHSS
ncbi:MAG: hypothetical protein HY940_02270 [Gammaproteobacteria bacterium]|nr:hypothetical protein [Gammaproteobacteria bacterium]